MNNSFRRLRLNTTGRLHRPGAVCHPAGSRQKKACPVTAPGYLWPWPGAAFPPSARPPHPQALGQHPQPPPPPPATGWRSDGPASRCGRGGGAAGHPRHGISSAKNGSADSGGLKIDPTKSTSLPFFAPKGAPLIFRQVLKKSRRSNKYFERY